MSTPPVNRRRHPFQRRESSLIKIFQGSGASICHNLENDVTTRSEFIARLQRKSGVIQEHVGNLINTRVSLHGTSIDIETAIRSIVNMYLKNFIGLGNRLTTAKEIDLYTGLCLEAFPLALRYHSSRVAKQSVLAAKELALPEKEQRDLKLAAQFHDFGKFLLFGPDAKKPASDPPPSSALTRPKDRPWIEARRYLSYFFMKEIKMLEGAAKIIQSMHAPKGCTMSDGSMILSAVNRLDTAYHPVSLVEKTTIPPPAFRHRDERPRVGIREAFQELVRSKQYKPAILTAIEKVIVEPEILVPPL